MESRAAFTFMRYDLENSKELIMMAQAGATFTIRGTKPVNVREE